VSELRDKPPDPPPPKDADAPPPAADQQAAVSSTGEQRALERLDTDVLPSSLGHETGGSVSSVDGVRQSAFAAGERGEVFVIGGRDDTNAVGNAEGYNHLDLSDWDIEKNDAWVDGAVDSGAPFQLATEPVDRSLVSKDPDYVISIYARELRQLHNRGYDLTDAHLGDVLMP
jgi:hypothetical protein